MKPEYIAIIIVVLVLLYLAYSWYKTKNAAPLTHEQRIGLRIQDAMYTTQRQSPVDYSFYAQFSKA